MGDRKRRSLAPGLEPMERRDVLSGLLIALQPAGVPHLGGAQVATIATNQAHSGRATAQAIGTNTAGAGGGLFSGGNNPEGITFPNTPLLGTGTPTAAELAREKFHAQFSGPLSYLPPRFSDQSKIVFMKGLGGSTPKFFLHGDYSLAYVIPRGFNPKAPGGTGGDPSGPGYVPPVTGFAFLDDKNNNSGGVLGLDLVADPTSFDAKGRPTRLNFVADPNVYGGVFYVASAVGVVKITYLKNTAKAVFDGRIYTSGLTSPFENTDLYRTGGRS